MDVTIQSRKLNLDQRIRDYVDRRIAFALGRFSHRLKWVRVTLADTNGPRGGVDKRCVIETKMMPHGQFVAQVSDEELEPAISRAVDRLARRVREALDRRRDTRRRTRTDAQDVAA